MSQGNYTVLFWVSLGCGIFFSSTNIVAAVGMLGIAAIYLVAGDICKKLDKLYGERKEGNTNSSSSVVETP